MLSSIVGGLNNGVLFALVGIGLVLVYRQSGVLNFAHGAAITVAAYGAYTVQQAGYPYWVGVVVAIVLGAAVSAGTDLMVVRWLSGAPEFTVAIATLGVALALLGVVTAIWGRTQVALRPPITGSAALHLGPVAIGANQVLALVVVVACIGGCLLLLNRTRLGLAVRASAEGPLTAQMLGVNVAASRTIVWGLSGGLAGVAALFVVPANYLDPDFPTTFMITAFAAVVLGGLESIGGLLAGSVVFGVVSGLFAFYITGRLNETLALVSILVILLAFPYGLFGRRLHRISEPIIATGRLRSIRLRMPAAVWRWRGWRPPRAAGVLVAVAAVVAAVSAPYWLTAPAIFALASVAGMSVAALSQGVVSGYSGQVSIGQSGFMVAGGYTAVLAVTHWHVPLVVALLIAIAAGSVLGVVLAVPAVRLGGVYLAVLTLAFALAVPELFGYPTELTGGANGMEVPAVDLFGWPVHGVVHLYWFTSVVAALAFATVWLLVRSPVGRMWIALRDTVDGAAAIGVNVNLRKLQAIAIGGALAGLAGALVAVVVGYLSPDSYTLWTAVYVLVAAIVGGSGSVLGPLLGAAFVVLVPIWLSQVPVLSQIAFGLAILAVTFLAPRGLASPFTGRRGPVAGEPLEPPAPAAVLAGRS